MPFVSAVFCDSLGNDRTCFHLALLYGVQVGIIVVKRPVRLHLGLTDHADRLVVGKGTFLLRTLLDVVK